MSTWLNNDGLYIKSGTDEGTVGKAGTPTSYGNISVSEFEITLTDLTSSAAILNDHVTIPSGVILHKIEVIAEVAATSGGSATLDVGLVRLDRTTAIDDDGIVAALALTSIDAEGDVVELVQGSTGHGALVGTTMANAGLVTAHYNAAAYTAGKVIIRIHYYQP